MERGNQARKRDLNHFIKSTLLYVLEFYKRKLPKDMWVNIICRRGFWCKRRETYFKGSANLSATHL